MTQTVCLDPGHGAPGSGASGHGIDEPSFNLVMAIAAAHELARRCIGCVLTRTGPEHVSFVERAAIARRAHVGAVVVLHTNADLPQCHGPMAFYRGGDERSRLACECFVAALKRPGAYVDAGVVLPMQRQSWIARPIGWTTHAYNCIDRHDEPAILVEMGYLSNAEEAAWLKSTAGQRELALAIADSVQVMLG